MEWFDNNKFIVWKKKLLKKSISLKDGKRIGARAMLVYMLSIHLEYSQSQISKMLKLNKATTSRDINYMENLNPKFSQEKKQLDKKYKINTEIVKFVENNNKK